MLNPNLHDFVMVVAGASASFIGLLFVAMTFVLDETQDKATRATRRILAESSYAALVNIFFVALVGVLPQATMGYVFTALAIVGLVNSGHYFNRLSNRSRDWAVLALSSAVYIIELLFGIYVLFQGDHYIISTAAFVTLIMFLFSISLGRAWELTGIRPASSSKSDR